MPQQRPTLDNFAKIKQWLRRILGQEAGFTLPDGRVLSTRLIVPADLDLLLDFRHQLSPESLRRRFRQDATNVSEERVQQMAEKLVDVDNETSAAILALQYHEGEEQIVGVARLARPAGAPTSDEAEIAFIVADEYQGQGIGRFLLQRLIELARPMGIRTLVANIEVDNIPALKLVRRTGLPQQSKTSQGETVVRMTIGE